MIGDGDTVLTVVRYRVKSRTTGREADDAAAPLLEVPRRQDRHTTAAPRTRSSRSAPSPTDAFLVSVPHTWWGTDTTATPGSNSSRAFICSARWLCRPCCHHFGTNSPMTTVTRSAPSALIASTSCRSGSPSLAVRRGDDVERHRQVLLAAHCSSIVSASSGSSAMCTARTRSGTQQLGDPQRLARAFVERGHRDKGDVLSRAARLSSVSSASVVRDVDHHDALLEQQAGLEPQRVVVPEHVAQRAAPRWSRAPPPRTGASGCSARSLCATSARSVHQTAVRVDELELAPVARPERSAEAAVLGTDVHRAHPVGVEVVDVAHRPVEPSSTCDTSTIAPRRLLVAMASVAVGLVELGGHVVVVLVHPHQHRHGHRHDDHDDPGAVGELGDRDHDADDDAWRPRRCR